MTNAKKDCKTFEEIKPTLDNLILTVKINEPKRSEAEWFAGLSDSDQNPAKANHFFYCCTFEDAKALKEYILKSFEKFSEGKDHGTSPTMVYLIAEY